MWLTLVFGYLLFLTIFLSITLYIKIIYHVCDGTIFLNILENNMLANAQDKLTHTYNVYFNIKIIF